MSPLAKVFAVKIFDKDGVGLGYLPRSQASLTQSEPRLWVRLYDAKRARNLYLREKGINFGAEIHTFELALISTAHEGALKS